MLTVMTPAQLLELLERRFSPLDRPPEEVELDRALGRVLTRDLTASEFVPNFARSTVDGYALRGADTFGCSEALPALLTCVGTVEMGKAPGFAIGPGQCAAIPTGGALPEGADSVQMVEYSENYGGGEIGIVKSVAPGANLIFRGDDVKPGDRVLRRGRRLEPQDIGALAALGVTQVPVVPRLKVGLLSTGDELVPPNQIPGPGQVRDVNGPLVAALFTAKLFLLPLLARLEGRRLERRTVSARLSQTVPANHGRAQYTGVRLEERPDGLWAVPIWGKSGLITTLAGASGFFCVPRDREGIPAGEWVEVSLFDR